MLMDDWRVVEPQHGANSQQSWAFEMSFYLHGCYGIPTPQSNKGKFIEFLLCQGLYETLKGFPFYIKNSEEFHFSKAFKIDIDIGNFSWILSTKKSEKWQKWAVPFFS